MDGVKVYSDKKRLINNTDPVKYITNFFANFYHGGRRRPLSPIHYEFGAVAMSTQYIGPPRKVTARARARR